MRGLPRKLGGKHLRCAPMLLARKEIANPKLALVSECEGFIYQATVLYEVRGGAESSTNMIFTHSATKP